MEQLTIGTVNGDVNISEGYAGGKCTEDQSTKLDRETKQWLETVATAVSEKTGNSKYGASSVAREAIHFYRDFFRHVSKLRKYRATIVAMLDSLP